MNKLFPSEMKTKFFIGKAKNLFISIVFFLLTAGALSFDINKPFWGEHDWNGARYSNIARNYIRYGVLEIKFAQIENSGTVSKEEYQYFTHYPPLLTLLLAGSFSIFGVNEWAARFIPILFTSGSVALIFIIGLHLENIRFGILASTLSLNLPVTLYFGKNPVHEPLVVFFVLLAFWGYLKKINWLFLVGLILAHLTTWAGFFLIPAITLIAILKRDFKEVRFILPFWGLPIVVFGLHIGHTFLVTGSAFGGDIISALLQRSGISKEVQPETLNLFSYLDRSRAWLFTLYTTTLVSMSFIWFFSKKFTKIKKTNFAIATLGIWGITYFLFFPNAGFIHNYLTFYLLPFIVLAGASVINSLWQTKFLNRFGILFPALIILVIFLERKDFLFALQKSSGDKFAVEVGRAINAQTNPEDEVLVSPYKFSYSADSFLKFYSDRKITFSDSIKGDKVKVLVDQDKNTYKIVKDE